MNEPAFPYDVFLSHSAKDKAVVRAYSLSASNGDLSRLGSGKRNSAEPKVFRTSERARASHWAGVRCRSLPWAERLRVVGMTRSRFALQPLAFSLFSAPWRNFFTSTGSRRDRVQENAVGKSAAPFRLQQAQPAFARTTQFRLSKRIRG